MAIRKEQPKRAGDCVAHWHFRNKVCQARLRTRPRALANKADKNALAVYSDAPRHGESVVALTVHPAYIPISGMPNAKKTRVHGNCHRERVYRDMRTRASTQGAVACAQAWMRFSPGSLDLASRVFIISPLLLLVVISLYSCSTMNLTKIKQDSLCRVASAGTLLRWTKRAPYHFVAHNTLCPILPRSKETLSRQYYYRIFKRPLISA